MRSDIFDATTASVQVHWPWNEPSSVGQVHIVTDMESALNGIHQIIEQGEGNTLSPNQVDTGQYGHFIALKKLSVGNDLF